MFNTVTLTLAAAAVAPGWTTVAPGVEHDSATVAETTVELLRFDLEHYRPEVVVHAERPQTAAAVRAHLDAAAVVNGGFFDTDWHSLGLRVAGGKTVIGLRPNVDWGVLVLRAGRAQILHSRDFQPGADIVGAIQVGPRILWQGQALKLKPQSARRTAVALDRAGRYLTVLVTRNEIEASRLAGFLEGVGFDAALLLDGGPSTQLSASVGALRIEVPGGYAVPDALVLRKR